MLRRRRNRHETCPSSDATNTTLPGCCAAYVTLARWRVPRLLRSMIRACEPSASIASATAVGRPTGKITPNATSARSRLSKNRAVDSRQRTELFDDSFDFGEQCVAEEMTEGETSVPLAVRMLELPSGRGRGGRSAPFFRLMRWTSRRSEATDESSTILYVADSATRGLLLGADDQDASPAMRRHLAHD